jgi:uncharacterized protein (DUF58 family)
MNLSKLLKAVAWVACAFLYAFFAGGKLPWFAFYTSLVLVVVGFCWAKVVSKVSARCYTETVCAQVGSKAKVFLEIENCSGWPAPWVQVWVKMPDSFCLPDNLVCYIFTLGPHKKKIISEEFDCKLRGIFNWGDILIRTGDIFGVFYVSVPSGQSKPITVFPQVFDLGDSLRNVIAQRFGDIPASAQAARYGQSFLGVRKYDAADGIARIHWKASAKGQSLLVKEFHQQKSFEYLIFIDASEKSHGGSGPDASLEKAVALTASLAAFGSRLGYGTGLMVCGEERNVIPVSYGKGHFSLILQTLVQFKPGQNSQCHDIITSEIAILTRNFYTFFITGHLDEKMVDCLIWLKSRRKSSTLFLLKLETFGREDIDLKTRDQQVQRLRMMEVTVIMVEKNTDLRLLFRGLKNGVS